MKAYSYVRFSTADQVKGDSQRRQVEAAEAWCKARGVQLVQHYQDLGVSAFRGKNVETGALAKFLQLVKLGKIEKGSFLVVESLDRLSRNSIMEALELFLNIVKAGVRLVTLSDRMTYDSDSIKANWTNLIISLTVMSRAHEESATKAMRIAASWAAKRKAGIKATTRCVAWLRPTAGGKEFEPIPEHAATVRRIFEMSAKGIGTYTISRTLRDEGVPPMGRVDRWHLSYIKKILANRAVIGEYAPHMMKAGKRVPLDPVPGYYPAVVEKELFATVQQMKGVRPSYRGRSSSNAFAKLAFDKQTGSTMVYVNKGREKGWHYLVPSAAMNMKAKYTAWPYDDFKAKFLYVCQQAALRSAETIEPDRAQLDLARMELDDANKQIDRLVDFLARGAAVSVESKLRELEAKKERLKSRVADLEAAYSAKPTPASEVDWRDDVKFRDNLRATVKRITVDAQSRSFDAEFLDGRKYSLARSGDTVVVTTPDKPSWGAEKSRFAKINLSA